MAEELEEIQAGGNGLDVTVFEVGGFIFREASV